MKRKDIRHKSAVDHDNPFVYEDMIAELKAQRDNKSLNRQTFANWLKGGHAFAYYAILNTNKDTAKQYLEMCSNIEGLSSVYNMLERNAYISLTRNT